ncbi:MULTISPECIES: DUF6377 domain-containing protein [Reichenbachiella]|uniref:DUF6377 domain-containing protein n=1 Tax=Reichenbachiella agariperforans TaxID=156994 RepID=A0A1M6TNM3_REIAG|nr:MULTISPECIES: DUF6377 domain-containing protein [Reichenbachiella]MBU2915509.1 hypothetical protein [Reichenbachiella agariperforans]PIB36855.1 hypothetical protein BFP72_16335 [Reichenbachiella sp. 5M10]RJE71426.1 hypothetical protein BGP76_04825 [Reichenbachiella sp. MSK19-1]SHK58499.1 hypothetical protein SAMN04488028_106115 [Reichenbachiella agariperforans]
MHRLLGLMLLLVVSNGVFAAKLDSLLDVLDQELAKRPLYEERRELKINSIKSLMDDPTLTEADRYHIDVQLIREYAAYNFDSALAYIKRNLEIGSRLHNAAFEGQSELYLAKLLAHSGSYMEAIEILQKVAPDKLDEYSLKMYYVVYRKVYEDLHFYSRIESNIVMYREKLDSYTDSLLRHVDEGSDLYLDIQEKEYRDSRQMEKCLEINTRRMQMVEMATAGYSLVAFQRSLIHQINGNREEQKVYLALSAISDIRAAIKDNASLTQLAQLLYEDHQIERAYRYIKFSFQDAEFFNSRLRFIEISNIFPLITAAYQKRIDQQNTKLRYMLLLISLLSVGLAVMVFMIFRQVKKVRKGRNDLSRANLSLQKLNDELKYANDQLNSLNGQLVETDSIKEQYIANFLNICSDFIDKLDNYRRMVRKMITSRKFEELLQTTSSPELIDRELKQFYATFDSTFLNIYPDFVNRVNELLLEDERIELKSGELLNTELRIFALIRLGIHDSSQISKLLRYSVNTIYNYRVKVKNKSAGPREEFEEQIMKISALVRGAGSENN